MDDVHGRIAFSNAARNRALPRRGQKRRWRKVRFGRHERPFPLGDALG